MINAPGRCAFLCGQLMWITNAFISSMQCFSFIHFQDSPDILHLSQKLLQASLLRQDCRYSCSNLTIPLKVNNNFPTDVMDE